MHILFYIIASPKKNKGSKDNVTLPFQFLIRWKNFLYHLNQVEVPRSISSTERPFIYELHDFVDASSRVYNAVIYIRTTDQKGNTQVHLLYSKFRVAPLKQLSITRLELCGLVLLSELTHKVSTYAKFWRQLSQSRSLGYGPILR